MQFNPEQLRAITHGEGPALVIAGPGSGKTAVLTNRIKYLIEHRGVDPQQILVITFSKAASLTMEERFLDLCEDTYYPVNFGTFHSIFFKIIHLRYRYDTSNIATLYQRRRMLRDAIAHSMPLDIVEDELIDSILKAVSYYKNCNEEKLPALENNITNEQFVTIYRAYREGMIAARKIDFEDMLLIVRNLFRQEPETLREYQSRYSYILIDECQDINSIQYDIVMMLGGRSRNIYMVGDDDQSIYRFRAANYMKLKEFETSVPGVKRINLSVNYRSTDQIIEAAGLVIGENQNRFAKNIRGNGRSGETVLLKAYGSLTEEDEGIIDWVKAADIENTAILLRTNREASRYAELLRNAGICVDMKENVYNPYKTTEFRDVIHYLRLASAGGVLNASHFCQVMNKPLRYLSRSMILKDSFTIDDLVEAYSDKKYMVMKLKKLQYQLNSMERMDLYSRVNYIRKAIGYDEYVRDRLGTDLSAYEAYEQNMEWIQSVVRRFRTVEELEDYAGRYSAALEEAKSSNSSEGRGIKVMTYHSSKGLEFHTVILPHVNEGSVPNRNSVGQENIEEERRMLYVAMTRAEKRLIMTYVEGRGVHRSLPSRFIYGLIKANKGRE